MLSLVSPEMLPPFILVISDPFSYTWAENESENLSALRKTAKPAASRRRRRLLLPRAPHPAQAPPRNGPFGGSQQSYQPDAAPREPAPHFRSAADVQFGAGT